MDITIRECTPADVRIIQEIGRDTFRETFEESNPPEILDAYLETAFNEEQVAKELAEPSSMFLLAEADGKAAGYLKINTGSAQTEQRGGDSLEIERIYVKNDCQGLGLGKRLLELAVTTAIEQDKKVIWLGVWEHNEKAIAFYQKKGFVRTGAHSFFVGDDEQTDWIMEKELV